MQKRGNDMGKYLFGEDQGEGFLSTNYSDGKIIDQFCEANPALEITQKYIEQRKSLNAAGFVDKEVFDKIEEEFWKELRDFEANIKNKGEI